MPAVLNNALYYMCFLSIVGVLLFYGVEPLYVLIGATVGVVLIQFDNAMRNRASRQ